MPHQQDGVHQNARVGLFVDGVRQNPTRVIRFDPLNPPDAIEGLDLALDELDNALEYIEKCVHETRDLIENPPVDVGRLSWVVGLRDHAGAVEDAATAVVALADEPEMAS